MLYFLNFFFLFFSFFALNVTNSDWDDPTEDSADDNF